MAKTSTRVYLLFGQILYIENFPEVDLYQRYKNKMLIHVNYRKINKVNKIKFALLIILNKTRVWKKVFPIYVYVYIHIFIYIYYLYCRDQFFISHLKALEVVTSFSFANTTAQMLGPRNNEISVRATSKPNFCLL